MERRIKRMANRNKKPNVLMIMTDQQKATTLDLYTDNPNTIEAKNLGKIAKEGTLFKQAYCAYPLCLPSRASIFSGKYPRSNGIMGNLPTLNYDTTYSAPFV